MLAAVNAIAFLLLGREDVGGLEEIKDSVTVFICQESEELALLKAIDRYGEQFATVNVTIVVKKLRIDLTLGLLCATFLKNEAIGLGKNGTDKCSHGYPLVGDLPLLTDVFSL